MGDRLHPGALATIEAAARTSSLAVSALSVWEVAMLVKRQRLRLPTSVASWLEACVRPPGVRIIPVGAAVALDSVQLPDFDHHRDPADRLIIATARRHGTLLTCDEPFSNGLRPTSTSGPSMPARNCGHGRRTVELGDSLLPPARW